jgi:hypothetical protein
MATFMHRLIFLSLTSLITFGIIPEAKAQSRMGMMMARRPMMMNPGMMNHGMNSSPFLMNPGVTSPGFPTFPGLRQRWPWWWGNGWWGWGYGMGLGYGLGGYGYGGLYPTDYSGNDSQTGYSAPRRQRPKDDDATPTVTPEQERERSHKLELAWSQSELSEHETRSAAALNILLADLQQLHAQGIHGPEITLDEKVLQHINVIVGRSSGNAGALRDEGRIHWPASLSGPEFEKERSQINLLAGKAVEAAKNGTSIEVGEISNALMALGERLTAKINHWPNREYIRAKRFLTNLNDALRVLRQPDAEKYFNGTYAAKGSTVAELVRYMTNHNLRFAPAMDGDEPAYKIVHRALSEYDRAAHEQSVAKN